MNDWFLNWMDSQRKKLGEEPCPYPVHGKESARECMAAGTCGCDNRGKLENRSAVPQSEG